ncbi:hypothetical protein [Rhodococcus koreensis]|uniref:Uncharacterized protein n=3 Tax=Rhodococcus TaxID=1827 RepID=A0A1H5F5T0_9NOCA|nr:hypothetical protein [Rhodococcus koreensis]SED98650.1 hypothetical protein SAMN04490239_9503 [Rhodococcus koreensis]
MRDLHESMNHLTATASPLGQQMIDEFRAGTYGRLAPMVAALDPSFTPTEGHIRDDGLQADIPDLRVPRDVEGKVIESDGSSGTPDSDEPNNVRLVIQRIFRRTPRHRNRRRAP